MSGKLIYAEVLDSTWWQEDVAAGFTNRTKNIGTKEEPNIVTLAWEEYLVGSATPKVIVKDSEDNVIKEYVCFTKDGNAVSVPNSYTSDKLKFVSEREFNIYKDNRYLIHLLTKEDIRSSPEDIHWGSKLNPQPVPTPYAWKGQILNKKFYYNNILLFEKEYYHTRDSETRLKIGKGKRFYFYKADGTKDLLKDTGLVSLTTNKLQVDDLISQTCHAMQEAYAQTVGTPLQSYANDYFSTYADLVEQDKRTGGTLFRDQIASETLIENPNEQQALYNALVGFLFYSYDTSHLTHEHDLGESPTIQEVLVNYLTFK